MDIEIGSIEVTFAGEGVDPEKIAEELKTQLQKALEGLSSEGHEGYEKLEVRSISLPEIEWDGGDRTGLMLKLLKDAF